MNCYGTNPRNFQQLQPVNQMNNYHYANNTAPANDQRNGRNPNPYNTTSTGEWREPIPTNPNMPTSPASVPVNRNPESLPPTLTDPIYTPGYLRQHIGDLMRVEFLIGNSTTDRVGRLVQVGASFIVLTALDGGSEIVCDIFSIKFVTIILRNQDALLDAQLYSSFQG